MTIRILSLLAAAALVGGAAFAWRGDSQPAPELQPLPVEVVVVEPVTEYSQSVEYTGTVVAGKTSELGFERSGKLVELRVDDGDRVESGTTLAILDTRQLVARRAQLESQLAGAKATLQMLRNGPRSETIAAAKARVRRLRSNLGLQERNYSRRTALAQSNAVSAEELDQTRFASQSSRAQLDEATEVLNELLAGTREEEVAAQEAQVAQLEATIRAIDVNLEDSVLKAPFAGTITSRYMDEGAVVNVGQSIVRLVDTSVREAHIGVPPEVALQLRPGDAMQISVASSQWDATLRSVLPELSMTTRTQAAVIEIEPRQDGALPVAGALARATVQRTVSTDGFWVPSTALERGQRGLWALLAVETSEQDGPVVHRRDVEVLFSTADRALVRGTLSDGDKIVASGTHRLVPGQRVSPPKTSELPIADVAGAD